MRKLIQVVELVTRKYINVVEVIFNNDLLILKYMYNFKRGRKVFKTMEITENKGELNIKFIPEESTEVINIDELESIFETIRKQIEQEELRTLQKAEAIKRLEFLQQQYKLHPNVLKEFKQDETIYYSEDIDRIIYRGVLYWLHNKDEYVKIVKSIEKETNIFVYHCILTHTTEGDLLIMLYVSEHQEEWDLDKQDIIKNDICAYVYNLSDDFSSEFGYIKIAGVNGGLSLVI